MLFVFVAQALQNFDGIVHGGSLDLDGLETSFERGILLDVLAIFVQGGGADTLHLATGKRGLDDIAGIHGALGRAGTHDGVQFVNEENDVFGATDFIHHRLDAFLKLAAILGARDHEGEIERDHAFVEENFRHIAFDDFLGQTFHDGRLAHARFTEQNRIVLGTAAKDLDNPFDFVFAADHGIHFALAGNFRQITTESLECGGFNLAFFLTGLGTGLAGLFFLGGFARRLLFTGLGGEVRIEFSQRLLPGFLDVHIQTAQHARGHAITFAEQPEQQMFGAHVGVIEILCLFLRQRDHLFDARGVRDVAGHFLVGPGAHLLLHFQADGLQIETHLLEHIHGHALPEFDQTQQQMFGA